MFRGPEVLPLVSLIAAAEREAMRRTLSRFATAARDEIELVKSDSLGEFVNSVTSTSRGAVLTVVLGDDILVVGLEGRPAQVADAWRALSDRKAAIAEAAADLIIVP